jgi:hypothetical protein
MNQLLDLIFKMCNLSDKMKKERAEAREVLMSYDHWESLIDGSLENKYELAFGKQLDASLIRLLLTEKNPTSKIKYFHKGLFWIETIKNDEGVFASFSYKGSIKDEKNRNIKRKKRLIIFAVFMIVCAISFFPALSLFIDATKSDNFFITKNFIISCYWPLFALIAYESYYSFQTIESAEKFINLLNKNSSSS